MSHEATNWAIKQRGLKPTAKILLWHLCDRYNPDHGCFPSQETLAEDCETNVRTIRRQLQVLEAAGLIRKEHRKGKGGTFNSDRYFLAFEAEFDQRTNCPADKLTVGQNMSPPADKKCQNQRTNCPTNPVSNPITKQVRANYPDQFEEFWKIVPRKVSKEDAFKAYKVALKKASPEELLDGMVRYAESRRHQDPTFTKHPGSWLRAGGWMDEVPHVSAAVEPERAAKRKRWKAIAQQPT